MIVHSPEQVGVGRPRPTGGRYDKTAEYYRTLLRRLPWPSTDVSAALRTLGVTSCHRREGVSTVAAHVAAAAASGDHSVLLIDANPANPSVHETFPASLSPGLAEVARDPERLTASIQPTPLANLSVLAAGQADDTLASVIDSAGFAEAVRRLRADLDLVIFDMPATGQESSAMQLAGLLDGVVLVVEAERVRWEVAQRTTALLRRAGARLLGAVLNKRQQHVPNWLYRTL